MTESFRHWIRWIYSYLWGMTIETRFSPFNGLLEVQYKDGRYQLFSKYANYSFGTLHKVFQEAFLLAQLKERPIEEVLLLGLGAGSVPAILLNELKLNCRIDAVEYDPVVIELAEKYFDLVQYQPYLRMIEADAEEFMQKNLKTYDLVVIDLFKDLDVPVKFCSQEFILQSFQSLHSGACLFFNFVAYTPEKKKILDRLVAEYFKLSRKLEVFQIKSINYMIYLRKE